MNTTFQLRRETVLAAITRGAHGCVGVSPDGVRAVPAAPIGTLVDPTGAGDLFAAGFVTGLVRGLDHASSAKLGALAAAEIIQHIGARPKTDLGALARANGLVT